MNTVATDLLITKIFSVINKRKREGKIMTFCIKCGQPLKDNEIFCPNCGWRIENKNHSISQRNEMTGTNIENFFNNTNSNKTIVSPRSYRINIIGLLASIAIFLGNILPLFTDGVSKSQSISMMEIMMAMDEINILMIMSIVTIVLILMQFDILAIISCLVTSGMVFYKIVEINNMINDAIAANLGYGNVDYSNGIGYYLLLIGAFVLIGSLFVHRSNYK